jgi:hypothetical protein
VFGVSADDVERMDMLLRDLAETGRSQRRLAAAVSVGLALMATPAFFLDFDGDHRGLRYATGGALLGTAALSATASLLKESTGEALYRSFRRAIRDGSFDEPGLAKIERRFETVANKRRRSRRHIEILGWTLAGVGVVTAGMGFLTIDDEGAARVVTSFGAMTGVLGATVALSYRWTESAEERLYNQWIDDPGIRRIPRLAIGPVRGGAALSLSGSF